MELFTNDQISAIEREHSKLKSTVMEQREVEDRCQSGRSEFERDSSRVMYSASFRRLSGKMQILGIEATEAHRNRLTHSLEVSRIARSIARFISCKCGKEIYKGEDFSLLDAASLAHDIGHPAFGHKGERVLDEFAKGFGLRFEGNAQNYRVVRKLDQHSLKGCGLNLTNRTLLAINKYVRREDEHEKDGSLVKKFMYKEDFDFLKNIREKCNLGNTPTLDAQIVELADDIAYAIHDLEDGLRYNILVLDDLRHELKNYVCPKYSNEEITASSELFENCIENIKKDFEKTDINIKTSQEYTHIFRKTLTSRLTHEFVWSIDYANGKLTLGNPHKVLCKVLSKMIFNDMMSHTDIALHEIKGEQIIKTLLGIYSNIELNTHLYLLPPDYRICDPKDNTNVAQHAIDYVSGMMDDFAVYEFERLTGISYDRIDITKKPDVKTVSQTSFSRSTSSINKYFRTIVNNIF